MNTCFDYLQVSDVLKRFATKITTSSVKERQKILLDLLPCVRKKGWLEPVVVATWHMSSSQTSVQLIIHYIYPTHVWEWAESTVLFIGNKQEFNGLVSIIRLSARGRVQTARVKSVQLSGEFSPFYNSVMAWCVRPISAKLFNLRKKSDSCQPSKEYIGSNKTTRIWASTCP